MKLRAAAAAVLTANLVGSASRADPWPSIAIPAQNGQTLRSPSPRPDSGDLSARAEHLATAVATGETDGALDVFLPRDPFLAIKDMSGAAGYFATLIRYYRRDIAAYRATLPQHDDARFVRFELSRHCAWMSIGREANRLPYWSCYGSRLILQSGGEERAFRVAVMINWGSQWYITHLGPIHHQ